MNFREPKMQWVFVDKDAANAFKDTLKKDRSIRLSGLPTVRKSLPENRGMSSPGFSVFVKGLGLMDTSGITKLARSMRGYLWGDLDGKFALRRPQENPYISERELAQCRGEQDTGRLQPLRRVNPMQTTRAIRKTRVGYVSMPSDYDPSTITKDDVLHDGALFLISEHKPSDDEIDMLEAGGEIPDWENYRAQRSRSRSRNPATRAIRKTRVGYVSMPSDYDPSTITEGDVLHDGALFLISEHKPSDSEIDTLEAGGEIPDWENYRAQRSRPRSRNPYVTDEEFAELGECRGERSWTAGPVGNPPSSKGPSVTLHFADGRNTTPLELSLRKDRDGQAVVRAANDRVSYHWNLENLIGLDEVAVPGGMWITGLSRALRSWTAGPVGNPKRRTGTRSTEPMPCQACGKYVNLRRRDSQDRLVCTSCYEAVRLQTKENPMKRNTSHVDLDKAGIENTFDALDAPRVSLWWFRFGAYAGTNVFVWAGSAHRGVEDALEEAAGWLADNAPGHLTSEKDMVRLYEEAAEDLGVSMDDEDEEEAIREQAETDMTYTESGWLTSHEWYVNELRAGDELYAEVFEASIDELAEQGDLDDDDIEKVNRVASELGLDVEWEIG